MITWDHQLTATDRVVDLEAKNAIHIHRMEDYFRKSCTSEKDLGIKVKPQLDQASPVMLWLRKIDAAFGWKAE